MVSRVQLRQQYIETEYPTPISGDFWISVGERYLVLLADVSRQSIGLIFKDQAVDSTDSPSRNVSNYQAERCHRGRSLKSRK
jgi:hypothetical protein